MLLDKTEDSKDLLRLVVSQQGARAEDLAHMFACLDLRVDVVVTFLTKWCSR